MERNLNDCYISDCKSKNIEESRFCKTSSHPIELANKSSSLTETIMVMQAPLGEEKSFAGQVA